MENHNAEQTIGNFFNENFHALVFSSFRIVKDYEQSKDIVQNVFVKIWQNYEKIKHISDLKPYLHTAVRNSSLNYLRDQKLYRDNQIPIPATGLEDEQPDEDLTDREEMFNRIHQAVDKLPGKWREAFILSKYEKLKYYEIAEKMKISDKTVEKYISKALWFLRSELKLIVVLFLYLFLKKV
jgi:RNA polymerase sigma-70 factor, ECF subfamily